jgi:hypothetical protein
VRRVWDGIYGLEGHTAALPHGLNRSLPRFKADGSIRTKAPAGSRSVPTRPKTSVSPAPAVGALGALPGYGLPFAEPARRATYGGPA